VCCHSLVSIEPWCKTMIELYCCQPKSIYRLWFCIICFFVMFTLNTLCLVSDVMSSAEIKVFVVNVVLKWIMMITN